MLVLKCKREDKATQETSKLPEPTLSGCEMYNLLHPLPALCYEPTPDSDQLSLHTQLIRCSRHGNVHCHESKTLHPPEISTDVLPLPVSYDHDTIYKRIVDLVRSVAAIDYKRAVDLEGPSVLLFSDDLKAESYHNVQDDRLDLSIFRTQVDLVTPYQA